MLSRRNFLLGSAAAVGVALPAVESGSIFVATNPWWITGYYVPLTLTPDDVLTATQHEIRPAMRALLAARMNEAQAAFDAEMDPVFREMFTSTGEKCGLAALLDDDDPDDGWN